MKKINGGRIAVAAGLGVFAIATWFAAKTPTPPPLPLAATTPSSSSLASVAEVTNAPPTAAVRTKARTISIAITSPTSSAQWTIGKENIISWNTIGGITGEIALVNATSGVVAGWIQQTIAPTQTSYPWNTRYLFINKTIPSTQEPVTPGKYIIKIYFASPEIPTVVSAPFFIVAPPQNNTQP